MIKINLKPLKEILEKYPEKKAQFEKVMDITYYLTSDYGCSLIIEGYHENIVKYIITGTRSQFSVCFDSITLELKRKPRNEFPWYTKEVNNIYMDEI